MTFRYTAISRDGEKLSGVIKAYDEFEAVSKLRETHSVVTHIEEVKETETRGIELFKTKIKPKYLALLCSQFSIIITSGLPIVRCVEMVASQTKDKELKKLLQQVAEDVDGGYSMAQSFENHGKDLLPSTFIETVRAGEQSGTLETCFKRLYRYYEKTAKTKAKVISTLTYPALVIAVAIIVFIIVMVVAVPMFKSTFEGLGIELPGITKALIAFSDFFTGFWWVILLIIAAFVIGRLLLRRTESGRKFLSENQLKRSPLHKMHLMSFSAEFANTMSTMLAAGLSVIRSLEITANVISNYTFAACITKVKSGVEQGRKIVDCMAEIEYFPQMLTEMTGVGERAGSLEETLDIIGAYFDNEVSLLTERLLAVLEPVITICLAVIVVILLLAVYLPIFGMYGGTL